MAIVYFEQIFYGLFELEVIIGYYYYIQQKKSSTFRLILIKGNIYNRNANYFNILNQLSNFFILFRTYQIYNNNNFLLQSFCV